MLIGADICLQHHVFRIHVIPQNRSRNPIEPLVVAAHENLVEGGFAGENPLHHVFVRSAIPSRKVQSRCAHINTRCPDGSPMPETHPAFPFVPGKLPAWRSSSRRNVASPHHASSCRSAWHR